MKKEAHVCPPWLARLLINPIRSLSQNPKKILQRFIREGDTVLDAGCPSSSRLRVGAAQGKSLHIL